MRAVSTRVLPLPAPAKIKSGPSPYVTASRWGGVRRSRRAGAAGRGDASVDIGSSSLPAAPYSSDSRFRFVMLSVPLAHEVDLGIRDHLLYELARDLSSSLELDVVLRKVMDRVITLMKASRGFIVLVDPTTGNMSVPMSGGEADPEKTRHFLGSKTDIQQLVSTGQPFVSTDPTLDARFNGQPSVILQNPTPFIAPP